MSKAWRVFILRVLSLTVSAVSSFPSFAANDSKANNTGALVLVPAFTNMDEIAKNLKVARFKGKKFDRKIKVAVLDIGFSGWEEELGKRLPKDTVYHGGAASEADKITAEPFHGLFMAELISEIIQKSGAQADYELHLFNAYGITKLTDAVETVIKDEFDLVLYAQVWEYGGNSDGYGFINALVDRAVKAGVIWINAAGDFGRLTRRSPVKTKTEGNDEWVVFTEDDGKTSDTVNVTCRVPPGQTCSLRLVLSWNDFKDDPSTGTDRDLDVFLYDTSKKQVGASEKNQALNPDENDTKASKIPRELIEATLKTGTYKARVKVKSKNFNPDRDDLRMTVSGIGIEMVNPTLTETILPPADNPGVIVVGASDDLNTNRSKEFDVPHVFLKSTVRLKDGGMIFSTSGASAMATGLATLLLGTGTEKTRDAVLAGLKEISRKEDQDVRGSAGAGAGPGTAIPNTEDGKARPDDGGGRRRSSGRVYLPPQRPPPYGYDNGYGYGGGRGGPNSMGYGQVPCATPLYQQRPAHQLAAQMLSSPGAMMVNFYGHQAIRIRLTEWTRLNLGRRTPNRIPLLTPQGIQIANYQAVMNGLAPYNYEIISDEVPLCGQGY